MIPPWRELEKLGTLSPEALARIRKFQEETRNCFHNDSPTRDRSAYELTEPNTMSEEEFQSILDKIIELHNEASKQTDQQ